MKKRTRRSLLVLALVLSMSGRLFGVVGMVVESHGAVELNAAAAHCKIDLVGGRILSYSVGGGPDVIWTDQASQKSDAEWIHGGVPICWPFFGRQADGVHGTAWRQRLEVLSRTQEDGQCAVSLGLTSDGRRLVYTVTLTPLSLRLRLTTCNVSDNPLGITSAIHPYFCVGERDMCVVRGIAGKEIPMIEAINSDFSDFTDCCEIVDPVLRRKIMLHFNGASSVGVWNPGPEMRCAGMLSDGAWKSFVCIEPRLGVARTQILYPGEEKSVVCEIRCIPHEDSTEARRWRPSVRWRGVNLPYCLYDKGVDVDDGGRTS